MDDGTAEVTLKVENSWLSSDGTIWTWISTYFHDKPMGHELIHEDDL